MKHRDADLQVKSIQNSTPMDAEDVQLYSESKTRVETSAEKRISPCSNRTCGDPQTQLMLSVFIGSDLMAPQDGDAQR